MYEYILLRVGYHTEIQMYKEGSTFSRYSLGLRNFLLIRYLINITEGERSDYVVDKRPIRKLVCGGKMQKIKNRGMIRTTAKASLGGSFEMTNLFNCFILVSI